MEVIEEKVMELESRFAKVEAELPHIKEILDRNTESYDKLSDIMYSMQLTLNNLSNNIANVTKVTEAQGSKIDNLSKKTAEIDNKDKFSILGFFNKYLPWIVVLIGFGMLAVSNCVKF